VQKKMTQPHSGSFPGPLFVVGMWRSGTSLLYALLNQHPEIALLYEGDLPLLSPLFWFPKAKSDWRERWEFWNSAFERHQVDSARIPRTVCGVAEAMSHVGREYARRKGATIWGCKSPNYYDSMVRLNREFQGARFIVIWRDPSDICRSILRAAEHPNWFRKSGLPHRALFGYRQMKKECDQLIASGVPVHEIEYEDLVQNPASVMLGVCGFLGVGFDERMLYLEGADRSAIYGGDHHALVKSEKIVLAKERPEVLPAALRNKVRRYVSRWQKEFKGRWPRVQPGSAEEAGQPGRLERYSDVLKYRTLRTMDFMIIVVFCFAPLSFLEKYRNLKRDRQLVPEVRRNIARPAGTPAD
jgi:sulfotransferase family protein